MTVLLITNTFPYGSGESFIEQEIPHLVASFEQVYILPFKGRKGFTESPRRAIPENVKVVVPSESVIDRQFPRFRDWGAWLLLFLRVIFRECGTFKSTAKLLKPRNFILTALRVNRGVLYRREYERILKEEGIGEHIVYSYWVDAWLVGILDYTRRCAHPAKVVSRTHRGDLYPEASQHGYQTCRKFIWKYLDRLYPISTDAIGFLSEEYPELRPKMEIQYLGVRMQDHLPGLPATDRFVSVSCSFVTPVKRVGLILEALKNIPSEMQITHYHIGNGPLLEEMKTLSLTLPSNCRVVWAGYKTQQELMEFYCSYKVDVFINVSESEGVPVSIMEAISFGIPVIATNVGGTRDVVNSSFGKLLDKNFSTKDLALYLEEMWSKSPEEIAKMRNSAFELAHERFNADRNFRVFCTELRRLAAC